MDLRDTLRAALERDPHIVAAWLYGSRARGTERPDSDVDIAILTVDDAFSSEQAWDLEGALEAEVRLAVQVVVANRAPADLVRRIVRDGILLVDRDRSRRVAFEVKKRNEYVDMTPIWRLIRRLPPGIDP